MEALLSQGASLELKGRGKSKQESQMTTKEHGHPGQGEPRSHGRTHHENFDIDLNEAGEQELAQLPMVGPDRARDQIRTARSGAGKT